MLRKSVYVAMLLLLAVVGAETCSATEYYFSALGNDATGIGTLANPWKSIQKFNTLDLNPGDQALFRAGDTFAGNLYLDPQDTGNNAAGTLINPILVGTYGASTPQHRAIISSPTGAGLFSYNNGGITIRDLEFHGNDRAASNSQGIYFYQDQYAATNKQESIEIDNVLVDGFGRWGALLQTDRPSSGGFHDVSITNSEFRNNREGGFSTLASNWTGIAYEDVYIGNVLVHGNQGYAGCSPHCGHGIVLGQVDRAVVEHSVAHSNGTEFGKGNVGIWTWQSNDVTIQFNEAYDNRSPLGGDGGGFDLDGGVTNSVVQYNRSRDNDGAGYLLAQFGYAEPMAQNVFRYNVSENDGRDNYGAITIWGETASDLATSAVFHNNTIVLDKNVAPNAAGAVKFLGDHHSQIDLFNNAFVATNGAELVDGTTTASKTTFARNLYWTAGAPLRLENITYGSLAAWAAAENQERIAGQFVGISADPRFADATKFRPFPDSPLIGSAIDTTASPWPDWLISLGNRDVWGTPVFEGLGTEIGTVEAIAGDFNGDGTVDGSDLLEWVAVYGENAHADADFDGDSDGRDLLIWQRQFQLGTSLLLIPVNVPEPAGLSLIMLSLGTVLSRSSISGEISR